MLLQYLMKYFDTFLPNIVPFCIFFGSFGQLITLPAGAVAKYCDEFVCLPVCPPGYLRNQTRNLYLNFCPCCLCPWLAGLASSGMLMIGRIARQWEGGDGSAQRGRSVIYDYLVLS